MKASKLFLLGTLVLVLFRAIPATAFVPTFTGDVEADFPEGQEGVLVIEDPGNTVSDPCEITAGDRQSGWDIKDLRLAYDTESDTLYVGINSYGIIGDVDGDGCPDTATSPEYLDEPLLCGGETVAVYFDLDMLPEIFCPIQSWDVIVGVSSEVCFDGFVVADWDETAGFNPPINFGTPISGHVGIPPTDPSPASPDFEFSIIAFSTLAEDAAVNDPSILEDKVLGEFRVGVYMGSPSDGNIGEDNVYYHQRPSTVVTIIPSALSVNKGDPVDLTVTEDNDSTAFRGNDGPTEPVELPFQNVQVEVTMNGSPLVTLDPPPTSGDVGSDEILGIGETWTWDSSVTDLNDIPITVSTEFVARGSGTGPVGFVHTYEEDPNEQDETTVEVPSTVPSTDVGISADPNTLPPGGGVVTLTITEKNDGSVDLLNPYIEVFANDVLIGTFDETSPEFQGGDDDGDGELDAGEVWEWTVVVPNVVVDTEFVVIGHGTDPVTGWEVTWCDPSVPGIPEVFCDDDERAEVDVPVPKIADTKIDITASELLVCEGEEVMLTICEENTGEVDLNDVYVEFSVDGLTVPLIPPLDKQNPTLTGDDDGDGELDAGETWCWTVVVTVNTTTIYDAIGHGIAPSGEDVTPPIYPLEYGDVTVETEPCGGCRLTGGGVDEEYSDDGVTALSTNSDRATFGGQAGANTALSPQPKGEWTHHQQKGPSGSFTFHGGTASAPPGSKIIEIRCSDPGGCKPSGDPPSPAKQFDFDGVGTFKNMGQRGRAPVWLAVPGGVNAVVDPKGQGERGFGGTYHWFEVNADDTGEPGNKNLDATANPNICPPNGFGEKGDLLSADCNCADFYRITIYNGVDAADVGWLDDENIDLNSLNRVDVIYEFHGYIDGGNLQIHHLTGDDVNLTGDDSVNLNVLAANWLEGF